MEGFLLLAVAGLAFYGFLQHRQIKLLWGRVEILDRDPLPEHDGYNPAFELHAFNRDH